ncbi:hypothetical protein P9112_014275 [Eukaryota sp. TZLM1-RC]
MLLSESSLSTESLIAYKESLEHKLSLLQPHSSEAKPLTSTADQLLLQAKDLSHDLHNSLSNLQTLSSSLKSTTPTSYPILSLLVFLKQLSFRLNSTLSSFSFHTSLDFLQYLTALQQPLQEGDASHVLHDVFNHVLGKIEGFLETEISQIMSDRLKILGWPSVPDFDLHSEIFDEFKEIFTISELFSDLLPNESFKIFGIDTMISSFAIEVSTIDTSTKILQPAIFLDKCFAFLLNLIELMIKFCTPCFLSKF